MNLALETAPLPASVDLDAYFARIRYSGARTPTLATLCAITARHPAAIPFEAIDVLLGHGIDLDPVAVDAKLITAQRGGYCFEHNSLLRRVLIALGFEVQGLLARVSWNRPADAPPLPRTHMVLRVTVDAVPWLVDVGFGACVPTTPLNLLTRRPQRSNHESFRLLPTVHGHRLEANLGEDWQPVYEISAEPPCDVDYECANWYTATHPQSIFRSTLMVARTLPDVRYGLLGSRLTVRLSDGEISRSSLDADGIEQALAELFGLPVMPSWRPLIEAVAAGAE